VRAASLIDARAQAADQDPDFSRRIREGIPVPRRFDETGAGASDSRVAWHRVRWHRDPGRVPGRGAPPSPVGAWVGSWRCS